MAGKNNIDKLLKEERRKAIKPIINEHVAVLLTFCAVVVGITSLLFWDNLTLYEIDRLWFVVEFIGAVALGFFIGAYIGRFLTSRSEDEKE